MDSLGPTTLAILDNQFAAFGQIDNPPSRRIDMSDKVDFKALLADTLPVVFGDLEVDLAKICATPEDPGGSPYWLRFKMNAEHRQRNGYSPGDVAPPGLCPPAHLRRRKQKFPIHTLTQLMKLFSVGAFEAAHYPRNVTEGRIPA